MLAAAEAGDVFALLEGGGRDGRDGLDALAALYGAVREPWLVRALLLYHARTSSARALELLARAPEPHARHLLDALADQLRAADRAARASGLAALAPLVARRPPWLHRLPAHPLARELLRAARAEAEPRALLHALLALAALLPAAPALAAQHAPDLAAALLRPAPPDHAPHVRAARRALFLTLYATHPCTLLDALRADLAAAPPAARAPLERELAPLLASVRLHPALLTSSRQREADPARWARLEPHDVLADCRRLSWAPPERASPPPPSPAPAPRSPPPPAAPEPGSAAHAARAAAELRPGAEPWFPLGERCGADSAPQTPLPAETDAAEPPEAAVEATPENTPARETRAQFRFPTESGAARAIGRRAATSPAAGAAGEAYAARLARVALERRAAESPVSFAGAGAAPAGLLRPEPRPAAGGEPLAAEDREVLELTAAAAAADDEWPERVTPAAPLRDPREGGAHAGAGRERAPLRPASCPAGGGRRSVAVQTVDAWPEPYEFLIADFYRCVSCDAKDVDADEARAPGSPSETLDAYIASLYRGRGRPAGELADQLALAHAQLAHERWRRELHAERNRRLLGRCRRARALELHNLALRERLAAARRDLDEARARPPPAAAPPADDERRELEARLRRERDARLRAEAALHDAEARAARDAAELRRSRTESHSAALQAEALAGAARSADGRAACARRLRRELLLLGEREARLRAAAARTPRAPPPTDERALRAAAARAEGEAEAARGRAEAAAARAHELEAALAAREAAAAELRRAARARELEAEARLAAVRDKYQALLRLLRAADARRLAAPAAEPSARAAPCS